MTQEQREEFHIYNMYEKAVVSYDADVSIVMNSNDSNCPVTTAAPSARAIWQGIILLPTYTREFCGLVGATLGTNLDFERK